MKNIDDLLPLAPLQALMFTHALAEPQSPLLVEQFRATIDGPLEVATLREAWQTAVARHAMLRAAPAWEGLKKPLLVVRERVELPWQEFDWRDECDEIQQTKLVILLGDDRRQGFELAQAPLWRVQLIRLRDERWQLIWTCHHLVLDGWSLGIVLGEVFAAYAQLRHEGTPQLPPAGAFRDYFAWLAKQKAPVDKEFWRAQLAGCQPLGGLPVERLPFEVPSSEPGHGETERRLKPTTSARLREIARRWRVGEGVLVQAAWSILLGRYFEREEVLFGCAVSGRPTDVPLVESIVGPFVNNVPLRVQVALSSPVQALCQQLQQAGSEVQPHEHCTLEQIAQAAGLADRGRLYDTLVVFENYPHSETTAQQVGDLVVSDLQGTVSSAFPLTLIAQPAETLRLRMLYDRKRYSELTASGLLEQVETLLENMVARPEARVEELSLAQCNDRATLACEGRTLKILDLAGQQAPTGMPGEVWQEESGTAPRRIGYRALAAADGELEYLGPSSATVQRGRFSVEPAEIARVLELHPLVARAAVVGHASRGGQTQLAAYIEPQTSARIAIDAGEYGLLVGQLHRFAEMRLPPPMIPTAWRVVDKLPLIASGEVHLAALPEPMRERGLTSHAYVAPRDEMESRVAGIWSQVLGVEPVGVTDRFVDLGGYSSLAVTLLARLESEFDRRLPLAALFEEPTVAHLAELLRSESATPEDISLVPLRAGGDKEPVFCVHPAGGTVFCYLELARRLDEERPVFGLQAAGIDGASAPHETVAAMAAHYVTAIKSVQPEGPYHVCGWSTGGVVAFELARQLRVAGDEVALLALFDAAIPRPGEAFGADDLLPMLELLFPTDDRQKLERLRELPASAQLEHFRERAEMAQLLVAGAGAGQAQRIYEVFQANMQAVIGYQPQPYDGQITLFRAADHATPMHADRGLGWEPWTSQGVEIHEIAAEHLNMLQEPAVGAIARHLGQLLVPGKTAQLLQAR